MEKRLLIAVVLSIGVLYAYTFMFPTPKPVPPGTGAKQAAVTSAAAPAAQAAVTAAPAVAAAGTATAAAPAALPAGAAVAKDITVDTDLFTAVFSSQGAALKKLVLKKYKETSGKAGADTVLVNEVSPDRYALLSDSREFGIEPGTVFNTTSGNLKLANGDKGTIEFSTVTPRGVLYKKTYTFSGDAYRIGLSQQIQNTGAAPVSGSVHLLQKERVGEHKKEGRYEVYGPFTLSENEVKIDDLDDLKKEPVQYNNNIIWTAFADKYFAGVVISEKGSIANVRMNRTGSDLLVRDIASPAVSVAPGQVATVDYSLYYGPKDLDILKLQGNRLEEVIDYGWFGPIAKPLILSLKYFYKYTGNYGVAIIIITVILKLVFFPLTHKSYKSMKDMQKLQPKMAELKEKFKNDRDAMNRAVMELYKTHKVNPLGGCLPMLVQIPVFFGLYRALMYSIELRHAPFYLWITDLSAKDPYYVTPIIMGATMFIQQKMTPTNMDPIQAKMMLALPIVFTFMFLNFPSGLVLYWLVNNILTIAQQVYINKTVHD